MEALIGTKLSGFTYVTAMLLSLEAEQCLTDKRYRTGLTSFYIFLSQNPSLSLCFGGLQTPWIRTLPWDFTGPLSLIYHMSEEVDKATTPKQVSTVNPAWKHNKQCSSGQCS